MRTTAEDVVHPQVCPYCSHHLLASADICTSCGMWIPPPPDHQHPPCWTCIQKVLP